MSDSDRMEKALIGAVLRDGTSYERVREFVHPQDFHDWNHQQVWMACEKLFEAGMGIDAITVGDEIERTQVQLSQGQWTGRALLTQLRSEGDPEQVLTYGQKVQDYSLKRGLDRFFLKCGDWSKNGRTAIDIIKDVNTELSKLTPYSIQDEYTVPVTAALAEAYDLTDRASRDELVGIPTGFMDLDRLIGGYLAQNIYLWAARTGQGKTAILLQQVLAAAKMGRKTQIFSLEMSRAQVTQRLIAQVAEIDLLRCVIRGKMNTEEWEKYHAAVCEIEKLPIIINDLSSIDINQVRQTARKNSPDIIFLDYIQLANSGEKKVERRELEVSAVSRGLKYLARELNIPVVPAAQLSRAVESRADKKPILSDLRESGSLEQDAYAVFFIHTPDALQNYKEVIIAKHRNGPTGEITLAFRPPFAKFGDAVSRIVDFNEKANG